MKSKNLLIAVIGLAVAVIAACPVTEAQEGPRTGRQGGRQGGRPGGPGGPGGGPPRGSDPITGLLRSKEVRAELKISDQQGEALRKLAEANRPKRPDGVNFREMNEEDRRELFEKMKKERSERSKEMKFQLEEILLPEQMERMEQIAIQVQGVRALGHRDVAEKLGITAEQKDELKAVENSIQDDLRERMRDMFSGGGDREGMREKMMEIREEMQEKVLSVLTSDQKSKFEELKGEPFDLPQDRGGFGGRGRGGFGGRPDGGRPEGGRAEGKRGRPDGDRGGDRQRRRGRPEADDKE